MRLTWERQDPNVDYDELERVQAKYKISEIEYRLEQLKTEQTELKQKLRRLQREQIRGL